VQDRRRTAPMGAANSSIPATVVPVDCCVSQKTLSRGPPRGNTGDVARTPRSPVFSTHHNPAHPSYVAPVRGLGLGVGARASRLQPLGRVAESEADKGGSLGRGDADGSSVAGSAGSMKSHAPQLVAERELLRREAPATMNWPGYNSPQSARQGPQSPSASSPDLEYGHFWQGQWQRVPQTVSNEYQSRANPHARNDSARGLDGKTLKLWVDGYLVSSPADRATFEAQLKGEEREVFFRALFERKQLARPGQKPHFVSDI